MYARRSLKRPVPDLPVRDVNVRDTRRDGLPNQRDASPTAPELCPSQARRSRHGFLSFPATLLVHIRNSHPGVGSPTVHRFFPSGDGGNG